MKDEDFFILTGGQKEYLRPLYRQVNKAFEAGEKGMIIAQFKDYVVVPKFIPHKYALKMTELMEEMEAEGDKP